MIRAGLGFGQLGVTIRGTTKYHLSPMEQKAFAGAISQGKIEKMYFFSHKYFSRSAQYFLEGQEVFLHRGASVHPLLSDLHGDREGARQVRK